MPRGVKTSAAPITYHVERVNAERWDVIAKVQLASCPNEIMAEVVADAIGVLNIPLVKGVRLGDANVGGLPAPKPITRKKRPPGVPPRKYVWKNKGKKVAKSRRS